MSAQPHRARHRFLLPLSLGLLLIFCATRLIAIDHFPMFLDETTHIELGERVQISGPLYNAWLGRLGTGWLQFAAQSYAAAPVWSSRAITVLAVLPGFAAILALGWRMAGLWGLILSGLLYLFSAYHLFFERLALGDPVAGSAALVALNLAHRLERRVHLRDAALCGLALFIAFVVKISILPYMSIPVLAALTLGKRRYTWAQRGRWLAAALVTMLGLTAAFVLGLRVLGHDYLSNSVSLGLTGRADSSSLEILLSNLNPAIIVTRAAAIIDLLAGYLGAGLMLLAGAALIILMMQRRFYLVLCLLLPALAMWFNRTQETRFWLPAASILLLCIAVVTAGLVRSRPPVLRVGALILVLVWGISLWLPFTLASTHTPPDLPLPDWDRSQYVLSDASGYGLMQAGAYLVEQQAGHVLGIVANCLSLRYMYFDQLEVICPRIRHDGSSVDELARLMEDSRAPDTYAVLEQIDYLPASAPGERVTVIERPPPGPALHIYDLSLPDSGN